MVGFSREYFVKLDVDCLELEGPWNKNPSHIWKVERTALLG